MAWYPEAIRRELVRAPKFRMNAHNRVNLHVAVTERDSLYSPTGYSGGSFSHFYVRKDGKVEQYMDTKYRAAADLEGNDATISVETAGGVKNPQSEPWTKAQVESLAKLFAWAVKEHGISNKMAENSRIGASSAGLSWHRLGIDGNFPATGILAGRLQRGGMGMHYSTARGKVCPGDVKIKQIPEIFELAQQHIKGESSKPVEKPVEKPVSKPAEKPAAVITVVNDIQKVVGATVDGRWGEDTDKRTHAVRMASSLKGVAFPWGEKYTQGVVGTKADGIWGANSRAAHDKAVKKIQTALKKAGYFKGAPNGIWNAATDAAFVKAWREHSLTK